MNLGERLPYDLKEHIEEIMASCKIQKKFRSYKLRHCHRNEWFLLRKLLMENIDCHDFDILLRHHWILSEWRTEPESWIFMLLNERKNLEEIIEECKNHKIKY